ncbi:hypothetical protein ACSSS7_000587 [Eimeria intestinalis]
MKASIAERGEGGPPGEARSNAARGSTRAPYQAAGSAAAVADPSEAAETHARMHAADSSAPAAARCCNFLLNAIFYALLAAFFSFAGVFYCLPPSHWLHAEARRLMASLPARSMTPEGLHLGPHLKDAAVLLQQQGFEAAAERLSLLSDWEHLDFAALVTFSLLSLLLITILIKSMLLYKREREIEVAPPPVRYCQNQMTIDEYNNKATTYAAVAELMASPEFRALKKQREAQGSEAWNWQKRGETETVTEEEEDEDEEETEDLGEAAEDTH